MNCAAIPEDSIEIQLFGYRHGAVPGGPPEKRGTLERANNGTLFLDEIGDMSLKTQAKVLRAMDEQRFTPVGTSQPVSVDVRIIAATNKNLEDEIARGNFREDLFYRLNVIPFYVPPLRDRREDIPILVREFLGEFGREYGRPRIDISEEALVLLKQYHWPGNVRELRNLVERLVILNPQVTRIERKHLPMLVHRDPGRPVRGFQFAAGGAQCLRARLHPEESGRVPRQHEPRRRGLGLGSHPSLPQDEGARHQRSRVDAPGVSPRSCCCALRDAACCADCMHGLYGANRR